MSCFLRDYSKGFNSILSTLNLKNCIDPKTIQLIRINTLPKQTIFNT